MDLESTVAVFDVETGKLISSFDPPGAYFLEQPEISPDGRYMFLAGNRSVLTPVDSDHGKLRTRDSRSYS